MKIIWNELYKIFKTKIFLVVFAVLIFANAVLCYATVPDNEYEGEKMDAAFWDSVEYLCKTYNESPEEYNKLLAEYEQAISDEFQKALGNPDYKLDLMWSPVNIDGRHKDRVLFGYVDKLVENKEAFLEEIGILRAQALSELKQLREDGESPDGYVYRYQAYVYNQYTKILEETQMQTSSVFGWEAYFSYSYGDVFAFAILILLSSLIFIPEKQSGMLPILRCAKRGRCGLGVAKICSAALTTIIVVLSFTFSTMAVIYVKNGFANPFVPVQCIEGFAAFPFISTVFSYFLFSLLLKIISAVCFMAIVMFFSLVFYQVLLTYVSGMAVFGVCFFLSSLPMAQYPFMRTANLLAISQSTPLLSRLYAMNLFEKPVPYVALAIILTLAITLLVWFITLVVYIKGNRGVKLKRLSILYRNVTEYLSGLYNRSRVHVSKRFAVNRRTHTYAYGLISWELSKILRYGSLWILLLVFLGIQIISGIQVKENYVNDFYYRDYLTYYLDIVEGEMTREKLEYVEKELDHVAYLEERNMVIYEELMGGKITQEEYDDFKRQYTEAYEKKEALEILEEKRDYLKEHYEKTGVKGWFLADQGIKAFLSPTLNIPLYGAVLILCAMSFSMEYAGKNKNDRFASVLRSTKNGRRKTIRAKYSAVILMVIGLGIILYAMEAAAYINAYSFDSTIWAAPLGSLSTYSQVDSEITIGQYIIVLYVMRIIALVITAVFMISVSVLAENLLLGVGTCVFTTMIPTVIASFGADNMKPMDFSSWFGINKYFCISAENNLFGNDFGLLILFTLILTAISSITAVCAYRKFLKG